MATSPDFRRANQSLLVQELALELARLDLTNPSIIGDSVIKTTSTVFKTDRVSLLIFQPGTQNIETAHSIGIPNSNQNWQVSDVLTGHVHKTREPMFVYDIRAEDSLASPWADSYRTDACALIPVIIKRQVQAVLCISNLSAQQLMQLENSAQELAIVQSQLAQLIQLIRQPEPATHQQCLDQDEMSLIGALVDSLERHIDTRSVFSVFCEVLNDYLPIDLLAVIHDCVHEPQQGSICVQRPVHRQEVNQLFSQLAFQWQRRHKRAMLLEVDDAHLSGGELIMESGDCPAELMLEQVETFPIFIDNDLFALVAVAARHEVVADRRRLKLFHLLANHLMLHVKKSLLLSQNQEMQTVDSLTGLYNERHFYQMMEREFDRAARYSVPLSLLFVDVDHFKDVNETYGFEAGDMLLKEISRIVMENMRSTDFCSRYSGERFVVVLPETHSKNSEIMANRLRRFIENNSFFIPNTNVFIKVTVSIGVASFLDHRPASLAQFIEFADTALYFAKRIGRNQVVGYSYVTNLMMKDTEHQS